MLTPSTPLSDLRDPAKAAELRAMIRDAGVVNRRAEVVRLNDYRRPVTVRVKLWDEV